MRLSEQSGPSRRLGSRLGCGPVPVGPCDGVSRPIPGFYGGLPGRPDTTRIRISRPMPRVDGSRPGRICAGPRIPRADGSSPARPDSTRIRVSLPGPGVDRVWLGFLVAVAMIDGFENAELDQAVIRIGLTVAVYSRNGDEPLPCLIQPAGRDEHVGVGVPQPHGPRQQPGPVLPRVVRGDADRLPDRPDPGRHPPSLPGVLKRQLRLGVDKLPGGDQMASHAAGLVAAQRSQFRAHLRRKHARLDVVGQRWGRTGLGRGRVVPQAVGAAGGTPVGTRRRAFPPAATGLAVGGSAAWSVGTGAVAVVPVAGRLRVAGRALQVALAAGSRCVAVFGRLRRLPAVPERTLFAFRAAWPTTRSATWTRRAPLALLRAWSLATRVCSPTFPARSTATGRVPRVTPAAAIFLVRRAEPWRGGSRVLAAPAPFVRAARPPPVDWTPLRARTVLGTSPVAGATAALALPGALTVAAARGRRPIGAAGALVACRAVAAVAARGRPPATGAATPLVPAVAA